MPETTLPIKEQIRQFVLDYASGRGITSVSDSESLLKNQVVDSLGAFRMIAFLEETFPLTIEDTDMAPENFETINDIETFVMGKLGMTAGEVAQPAELPAMAAS